MKSLTCKWFQIYQIRTLEKREAPGKRSGMRHTCRGKWINAVLWVYSATEGKTGKISAEINIRRRSVINNYISSIVLVAEFPMYNIAFSVRNSKTGRILILYSVYTLLIYIMWSGISWCRQQLPRSSRLSNRLKRSRKGHKSSYQKKEEKRVTSQSKTRCCVRSKSNHKV